MSELERRREELVEGELRCQGIRDEGVLGAMRTVPREAFLAERLRHAAYRNAAMPIECGQTISQPVVVAWMTEALQLRSADRVLEIGTGSGYAAAVLSRLAAEVISIERHAELAQLATERLRRLGYENVRVFCGDGSRGKPEDAPFDAIIVAAAAPTIPIELKDQLRIGGRLVVPTGGRSSQQLLRVTRRGKHAFTEEQLGSVRFVPLLGAGGWNTKRTFDRSPED